ncbi:MAG: glycoside hydrolase family 2 [Bacteroidaceae bacterium]|nr:glycoside hydrolase family 2 [Bacteroidaceae bacterium]
MTACLLIAMGSCGTPAADETLYSEFQNPPVEAKPRVWWHWMDGNVTKDGIFKDLTWMKRSGIAGFMNFDAGFRTPLLIDKKVAYMTDDWKDAFAYTVHLADSLDLEMSVAASPGWSFTGGPWVEPKDGMKKLVWREMRVTGGTTYDGLLPMPYRTIGAFQNVPRSNSNNINGGGANPGEGYYEDISVLAFKLPEADRNLANLNPRISSSGGSFSLLKLTDGDLTDSDLLPPGAGGAAGKAWIQYEFSQPQTVKALTIVDGRVRGQWGAPVQEINKALQVSDDGVNFREVCKIPNSSAPQGTVDIPETTARYFRLVLDNMVVVNPYAALMGVSAEPQAQPTPIAEFVLHSISRINHAEEKAGFAAPADLALYDTPDEAAVISLEDVIDITDKVHEGRLVWDVPEGTWKIVRYGYSQTGHQNNPAPPEATGFEVDKMDPVAFRAYMDHYLGMYVDASKNNLGKVVKYIMTDSYESEQENWTPAMEQEFEVRNGYSLRPWMPVLLGHIVNSSEESEKFLRDWRRTLGSLVTDNCYNLLTDILKERGMGRYTESHENGRVYLVDGMEVKAKADVPMSAAWMPNNTGASTPPMSRADIRESASVAHIYGQNLVAGESLTAPGGEGASYAYHPANLKSIADMEMASGLNRFVIHTSVHQPLDELKPGLGLGPIGQWFNRLDNWSESAWAWTDYLARSCYLLQKGKFVADIVYYYGEDNNITGMFGAEQPPFPAGYNYDYINSDAMLNLLTFEYNRLQTPSGMSYRMLVLDPNVKRIPLDVLKKIAELAKAGAVICGAKPELPGRLTDDVEEFNNIVNEIWGGSLKNVYLTNDMKEVLDQIGVKPDVNISDDLRFVHRHTSRADIYWINNPEGPAKTVELSFRVKGKKPEIWHPETGKREEVTYHIEGNRTVVKVKMVENDALFVVFNGPAEQDAVTLPELKESALLTLDTPWNVSFQEKRGAPASAQFDKLINLADSEVDGIKYFSGVATYTNSFSLTADQLQAEQLLLDLGNVGVMAEVTINGQNMGLYWKSPFRLDIKDALQAGDNSIKVKVTNLWINRLIGDSRPEVTEKITWSQYPFYNPRSQMSPSGLMGPVQIIACK